jgi:hypothetical protein
MINGSDGGRMATAALFRSSVFSKMNVYLPLAGAALILVLALTVPGEGGDGNASRVVVFILIPVLVAAALVFGRLVVTFDGRDLVLAYAFIKKRIPLEKVYAVEPHEIKWWRFGGTGIRFSGAGWAWITGSGPGVKIETTRGTTYANCEHPERLSELVKEFKGAASDY